MNAEFTYCDRIKDLRESRGFTQKYVADNIHVDVTAYQKYEYGKRVPIADVIRRFCKFYNISADYLLGLINEPLPIERNQ